MPSKPYGSEKHKGYEIQFRAVDPAGNEHRIRKRMRGVSKAAADAWERKIKDGIVSGTIKPIRGAVPEGSPLFRTFVEDFLRVYPASAANKPSEIAQKTSICKHHLTPYFGALPLDSPDWLKHIAEFKAAQLEGRGPTEEKLSRKTVNNQLTVLNRIFAHAVECRKLEQAPRIKQLKVGKREMLFYEREQMEDLLREAAREGEHWFAMVLFAAATALRLGELEGLEWQDIDLKRKRVTVRRSVWKETIGPPKSGHDRIVPLTDEVIAALKAMKHARPRVFSRSNERPMNAGVAEKAMARITGRARLRGSGWHILRHTAITYWVREGVNLRTVQAWAGHASLSMTMRYAHHAPDQAAPNPINFSENVPEKAGQYTANDTERQS